MLTDLKVWMYILCIQFELSPSHLRSQLFCKQNLRVESGNEAIDDC